MQQCVQGACSLAYDELCGQLQQNGAQGLHKILNELSDRGEARRNARDELAKKRAEQTSVRPCRAVALAWRAAGRGPLA